MRYRFARPKGTLAPTFQGSIEGEARRVQSMRGGFSDRRSDHGPSLNHTDRSSKTDGPATCPAGRTGG